MDAKEFVIKIQKICRENRCKNCPLRNYDCGNPIHIYSDESCADQVIKIVENYKLEEESE